MKFKNETPVAAVLLLLFSGTFSAGSSMAASAVWDVDVNPINGFGGRTATWGLNDPGTFYGEWNVFSDDVDEGTNPQPITDLDPDVAQFNADMSVTENNAVAFVTSGGNIYSFAAVTDFDLEAAGTGESSLVRTLALRLGLIGTDIDPASVLLDGVAPALSEKLFTEEITGGFGGAENEWLFIWSGVSDRPLYSFDFTAAESSMSLDQLAVYASAAVVPVPAAVWLFGSALGLLGWVRGRVRTSAESR